MQTFSIANLRVTAVRSSADRICYVLFPLDGFGQWIEQAAARFGVSEAACRAALADFTLPGGRWRIVARGGVTYIDDTYNANPTSMVAALETFAALPVTGRRLAVLGDMFELGDRSAAFHAQVKARAKELPLDEVIFVGAQFGGLARDAAKDALAASVRPGDAVLLKASHSMHLDELLP